MRPANGEGIFLVNVNSRPLGTVCLFGLLLASGCTSGPAPPEEETGVSYEQRVSTARAEKDKYFRESGDSDNPFKGLSEERRNALLPLSYYPVDQTFAVPASLKVAEDQPVFDMPTSTGKMRKMRQVGTLVFTLKGQPLTLGAFADANTPDLSRVFVPFADATTGKDTYEAGRYLDIDRTATGNYIIDFNEAYNPYCAYNATFECPYPPQPNRLKVPVLAGEKVRQAALPPAVANPLP